MKTLHQIREAESPKRAKARHDEMSRMPYLIILKRKSIRIFPDGTKVGLYYSDRLKKVFTVPFTDNGVADIHDV